MSDAIGAQEGVLTPITILVATMTGTAEIVAQEIQQALAGRGCDVAVQMMDDLDAGVFADGGTFLICTSTYGFGNVPDNAQDLVDDLESTHPDLSGVTYGVIALGDRTYGDTFCNGGMHFDQLLSSLGARRVGEVFRHDASSSDLAEEVARAWALDWVHDLNAAPSPSAAGPAPPVPASLPD